MERDGGLRAPRTSWSCGCSREGKVDGLRIDHPDGLYDPRAVPATGCSSTTSWPAPGACSSAGPSTEGWTGTRSRRPLREIASSGAAGRRRPAAPAALRRGREDPRRRRAAAGRLAGRTAPPATTSSTWSTACSSTPANATAFTRLYRDWIAGRHAVRGAGLPEEVPDPAGGAVERAAHAGPPARSAGPEEPLVARLHAATACGTPCARSSPASRSIAPTSPTASVRDARPALRRSGRPPGQAPQPGPEPAALRLRPRHAAAASTRTSAERGRTGPSSAASPASSSR